MKIQNAVEAFQSLAQETRLQVFRLLVQAGPKGLPAGEIANRLGVPAPTLSFHLAQLVQAGLAVRRREGRSLFYGPNVEGVRRLTDFLLENCCQGSAELCAYVPAKAKKAKTQRKAKAGNR